MRNIRFKVNVNPGKPLRWMIIYILIILSPCSFVFGDIYTWTDEHGKRHMSDQPPQNSKHQSDIKQIQSEDLQVNTIAEDPQSKQRREKLLQSYKKDAKQREKSAKKKAKKEKKLRKKCGKARTELRKYQDGWRIYKSNESGEREYLNEKQRQEEIKKIKKMLKKCPAPK